MPGMHSGEAVMTEQERQMLRILEVEREDAEDKFRESEKSHKQKKSRRDAAIRNEESYRRYLEHKYDAIKK